MANIDKTKLKLSIWDIVRQLNDLNEQPEEVLALIPQKELDEIISQIEQFKKFSSGISANLSIAKTFHKLKKGLDANV